MAWGLWLAAFVLFLPASRFSFVNYDDFVIVFHRAQVFSGLSLNNLLWAFSTLHADFAYWMPLTWITHQFDCHLFGPNPGPHHLTSVILHSFNTLLLFSVLHRMTGYVWRSACVALLFALHPLHVETVAWVSERKSLVCSLFWMLTMLAYVRYAALRTARNYLWVFLGCLGALMGKPAAVTLPLSLLLLDYWPLNRWHAGAKPGRSFWKTSKGLILEKLPLFGLSAAGSIMAYFAQKEIGAVRENVDLTFRVGNGFAAFWLYIRRMIWPAELSAIYERSPVPLWLVIWGVAFVISITVLCWRLRNGRPYLLMGWLWYLGNLVPSIGVVPIGSHAMADRYTYLPLIGVFIMLVWGLADIPRNLNLSFDRRRVILAAGAGVVFLTLTICTRRQLSLWHDGVSLFSHAVKIAPSSAKAHYLLGMNLASAGRYDLALFHANESVRLDPGKAETFCLYGNVLSKTGKPFEAKAHYEKALAIDPNQKKALYGLAWLLSGADIPGLRNGQMAVRYAERLCQLTREEYPEHLRILACSYAEAGRYEKAIMIAKKARATAARNGDLPWVSVLEKELALFRAGQPVRQPWHAAD